MLAYEMASARRSQRPSSEEDGSATAGDFFINPFCVAAMPEEIRTGFVRKVFGIITVQMVILLSTIMILKYTPLGLFLFDSYYTVTLITIFVPFYR